MQEEGSRQFTARAVFSFEDFKALHAAVRARSRLGRWTTHVWLIAPVCSIFFLFAWSHGFSLQEEENWLGLWPELKVFLIFLTPWLLLWELALRFALLERMKFKRCSSAAKDFTYRLDEKGAAWATAGMRGEYEWFAIDWAAVTRNAIVLMVDGVHGLVLPERGFASREEFEAAAEFARAKKSAPGA